RGPLLKDDHRDAPPPELDGERQATRTRPDDHDGAVALPGAHADNPVSRLRALMHAALKSELDRSEFWPRQVVVASYENLERVPVRGNYCPASSAGRSAERSGTTLPAASKNQPKKMYQAALSWLRPGMGSSIGNADST